MHLKKNDALMESCSDHESNLFVPQLRRAVSIALLALPIGCATQNQQHQIPFSSNNTYAPILDLPAKDVPTTKENSDCLPASQITYIKVRRFQEGVAVAQDENGFLFIDRGGNPISEHRFDYANSFYKNRALVKKNDEFYYIDHQMNYAKPPEAEPGDSGDNITSQENHDEDPIYRKHCDYVGEFEGGMAPARKGDQWFHVGLDGSPAYEERYDRVGDFSEDLAVARIGNRWFHIGRSGKPYPNREDCPKN